MARHVDTYGRALPRGRRHVFEGRQRHRRQERPLPFHLQCHPQRAEPVRHNYRHNPEIWWLVKGLRWNLRMLLDEGRYEIMSEQDGGQVTAGYTDCLAQAIATRKLLYRHTKVLWEVRDLTRVS